MKNNISTTKLAKLCGVSQGTVDRALNNRKGISEKTKERILAVAEQYGYRPNIHARSIAGGRSMLIGVVVFDLNNQYFSDILMRIEEYCAEKNYSAVVMFTDKDPQKEIECIKNLYHMAVDGIVLCPINHGAEFENYLLSLDIPIVTVGNRIDNIPYAGIDNYAAMSETVKYVLSRGYKRPIYVKPEYGSNNAFGQTERLRAFLETVDVSFVVASINDALDMTDINPEDAFICPTDIYAVRLYEKAKSIGAGIIGFDNITFIDELGLKLDSVAYDVKATAESITEYIINGIPISSPIKHWIIKRGSV